MNSAAGAAPVLDPEGIDRNLSAAEIVQKVYLGVTNKVITTEEARRMIRDAGGPLDVGVPAVLVVPELMP